MLENKITAAVPEPGNQVNPSTGSDLKVVRIDPSHHTPGPQEIAFHHSAMTTLLLCATFAYIVLFASAFMMKNFFAIKILSVEAFLILAVVFFVNKR